MERAGALPVLGSPGLRTPCLSPGISRNTRSKARSGGQRAALSPGKANFFTAEGSRGGNSGLGLGHEKAAAPGTVRAGDDQLHRRQTAFRSQIRESQQRGGQFAEESPCYFRVNNNCRLVFSRNSPAARLPPICPPCLAPRANASSTRRCKDRLIMMPLCALILYSVFPCLLR